MPGKTRNGIPNLRARPTVKQRLFVAALIQGLEPMAAYAQAGYSHPKGLHTTMKEPGVLRLLEVSGINVGTIDGVVSEVLYDDQEDATVRLRAADIAYKRLGAYAPSVHVNIDGEEIMQTLRDRLNSEHTVETQVASLASPDKADSVVKKLGE